LVSSVFDIKPILYRHPHHEPEVSVRSTEQVPRIQSIYALCKVAGGGQKVYGIAEQTKKVSGDRPIFE
jgi:hypothetical protein